MDTNACVKMKTSVPHRHTTYVYVSMSLMIRGEIEKQRTEINSYLLGFTFVLEFQLVAVLDGVLDINRNP